MAEPVRASLLIATYNWPAALSVALSSVRSQRTLPIEVIIADDGSADETRALIEREAASFPVPLRHVWHEDAGFRLATIRNKSMAAASGDYLIQIDGDLVLHTAFVEAHVAFARRGAYAQGSRAMLDARRTAAVLAAEKVHLSAFSAGVRNRTNALFLPALGGLMRGPADPLVRTRGCNMAFWRDDIVRVNGYNEVIEGWGREDSELAVRLQNAGVRRRNLKFSAVAWHLDHRTRPKDALDRNHAEYERAVRERLTRCERGIDQWIR